MNEKKLYALTDDVASYIKQGLQARASGFRANGDVENAAHVQKIADALTPVAVDDIARYCPEAAIKPALEAVSGHHQ